MQRIPKSHETLFDLKPPTANLSPMPLTLEKIVEETSQWPHDVVDELVERIRLARHGGIAPPVEQAWRKEVSRRVDEIRRGEVPGVPGEEVSARIRKIVGR
jgi:putative addiction module component (TIGR02574 family)